MSLEQQREDQRPPSDTHGPGTIAPIVRPAKAPPDAPRIAFVRSHGPRGGIVWYGLRSFWGHAQHFVASAIATEDIDSRDWVHPDDPRKAAIAQVEALARQVGAFVANTQIQAGQDQVRSATLEIRVPAARFDDLVHGLAPLGKLEFVNISAQDVGEEFTDITARVANARRLESRLIELLATRTGKLSDVMEIERELARVREEIERMEGRLRYLKAHVATSSLSVTVHEPAPVVGETGSGGVIADAFRDAWRNFVQFVAGLIKKDPNLDAARRLFEILLDYTKTVVPGFQLIVTEHANFADEWFQDALVEEPWMNPPALVPHDWPSWQQ